MPLIPGAEVSVRVPPPSSVLNLDNGWESFQFQFHDFASLDSTNGHHVVSPTFICNGHKWQLRVHRVFDKKAREDQISIYLHLVTEGSIATNYQIAIIDQLGKNIKSRKTSYVFSAIHSLGKVYFIRRSDILNNGVIGSDGALTIVVSIEGERSAIFVPKNSAAMLTDAMFDDEATADVCFEVACVQEKGKQKIQKSSVSFHAHRIILSKFAPMLAELVATSDKFSITDVKPKVFRHLLYYVYGGEVPNEELKKHAKDIIDAADKYAIVNLKLTAEVAYVESTDITIDNAIDNLVYADGKNCALLKEKVMNFLADHPNEAAEKISFADCPALMKDLLIAFGKNSKKNSSAASIDKLSSLSENSNEEQPGGRGVQNDDLREHERSEECTDRVTPVEDHHERSFHSKWIWIIFLFFILQEACFCLLTKLSHYLIRLEIKTVFASMGHECYLPV